MTTHQVPTEPASRAFRRADAEPSRPSGVAVRPIRLPEERDLFAGLSVATFSPAAPWETTRRFWGEYNTGHPYFRPGDWLGAFAGEECLGGVAVYRRTLRVGVARVPLACVASVVVRPEHRGQGIATSLLRAAEAAALERGDALLLLHGIPRIYRRFGYSDVFDPGLMRVTREALGDAVSQDSLSLRPATTTDADALLRLFERHFGGRVGALDRELAIQRHFLEWRIRDVCPIVAYDSAGAIRGYLVFEWSRKKWGVNEAVAEDWPAALALMRHVADLQEARGASSADIVLPCPIDSTLAMAIADNVWANYEVEHDADAGWMAKLTDPRRLCEALAPELRRRWRCAQSGGGPAALTVDGLAVSLGFLDKSDGSAPATAITNGDLAQLAFGYRPASWIAGRSAGGIDTDGLGMLDTLFPPVGAWIAGTDWF